MSLKKTVLLTGGAGYIGMHTAIALTATGKYQVIIVDNMIPAKLPSRLEKLCPPNTLTFVAIDIATDLDKLKTLQFDCCIHFAAKKSVGESVEQPLEYYRNNVNAQLNVIQACKDRGVKHFVFSSSATVYQPCETPLTEESPIGASNPYGQTKVIGEQILKDYCVANPDCRAISLRYFNPIGAHPSGTIGEAPETPMNILPIIQKVAVGQQDHVTVMGTDWPTPDGTGVRDYIHVMDLAEGHVLALDHLFKLDQGAYEVYNLGTGKGVSVLEMIKTFEKVNNLTVKYITAGRRAGDLSTVVCSPTKAEKVLGFKAKRTLEDACASAWNWQKANPHGFRD